MSIADTCPPLLYTHNMEQTIRAVRAITSEYAKRWLWLPLVIGVAVYVVVMGLIWWVAVVASAWWWLLAIVPTFVFLVALTLWMIARMIVGRMAPVMSKKQKKAARRFVGRIDKVAERLGTPKFVILYRILKDVIAHPTSSKTYIGEIASEPGEMRRAFDELRSLF